MLTQTREAETTLSKSFDAISQQSVKQKTFVAFYTPRENSVNTKGRRDQSTGAESLLLMPLHPLCVCHSLGVNLTLKQTGIEIGGGEKGGSDGSCGILWFVKGMIIQRECMDFGRNL